MEEQAEFAALRIVKDLISAGWKADDILPSHVLMSHPGGSIIDIVWDKTPEVFMVVTMDGCACSSWIPRENLPIGNYVSKALQWIKDVTEPTPSAEDLERQYRIPSDRNNEDE